MHPYKRSLQFITFRYHANGRNFLEANKYLFTNTLLFGSREGSTEMSPSCENVIVSINASNASLEALIATYDMKWDATGSTLKRANDY